MAGKVCSVLLVPGHDWDTNCNVEFYFISSGNPNIQQAYHYHGKCC